MIKMLVLLELLLGLALSSRSLLGFDTATTITDTHLKCLQNRNYLEETYIQLYRDTVIVSSVDEQTLRRASIEPHVIIIVGLFDDLYPEYTIAQWKQHLLTHNYSSIWLTWGTNGGFKVECLGIWKIAEGLSQLTQEFGIYMSQQIWEGNEYLQIEYCQKLNKYPLFYQSQGKFSPFNGWNTYSLKVSATIQDTCQLDQFYTVEQGPTTNDR